MLSRIHDLLADESPRHVLWAPVGLALGIGLYFLLQNEPVWWGGGLFLFFGLVGCLWLAWRQRPLALGMVLLLPALGFTAAQLETHIQGTPMLLRDLGFANVKAVVGDIERLPAGRRVMFEDVAVDKLLPDTTPLRIRLTDKKAQTELHPGDKVELKAYLRAVSEPTHPAGYDFRRHAFYNQIGATGFVAGDVAVIDNKPDGDPLIQLRQDLRKQIYSSLSGDRAAIADALLTGEQQGISEATLEDMRYSGLTHILSVSGLHIGLAAGLIFFIIRALLALSPALALRYPIKKWAAFCAISGAVFYTLFAGAPVPAVRSLIMTCIALLAIMVDRTALSLRVVAIAAFVILLVDPHALVGPSFQLSFAAVIAIIALYEKNEGVLLRADDDHGFIVRGIFYIGAIALTSLVASIATAPLTYYHFQQLSFYGVISNMLAVPLTSFWLMPMAVLSFMLMGTSLAAWPLQALGYGVGLLIDIAHVTAELPGATWQPAALRFSGLLMFVLAGLWFLIWQQRWRYLAAVPLALGIIIACFPQKPTIMVSNDARYVAVKEQGAYTLIGGAKQMREESFVPEQWASWLGIGAFETDKANCDATYCRKADVSVVRDVNILAELCNGTGIVIYGDGALNRCGARDIDRYDLWKTGAIAIYEDGGMDSVAANVGNRPWTLYGKNYKKDQ